MDKKIVFIIIVLIICMAIGLAYICYMTILNGNGIMKLNKKVSKLQESLLNDKELNFAREEYVVFLSVSDSNEKAYVTNGKADTLKKAIEDAKSKMNKNISLYKINPEWVRIDVVNKEEALKKNLFTATRMFLEMLKSIRQKISLITGKNSRQKRKNTENPQWMEFLKPNQH